MGITRPTGEQLRFRSQFTGDHVLDTYLEASEKGNRQLSDLLDDLFDSSGVFRAANFEFRFDEATDKIQFRAGNFASSTAGWTDITTFFKITGTFNSSTTYNNFDLITLSTKDIYIVHGLSSGTTFADEAAVIASSNTDKLVDVSEARDWAKKTDGIVDSTDYSAKAWAIGGTGVTNSATGGAAKEWATKTSGTVDGTNFSAKYWATHTDVVNVSTNIASVTSVASAISNVNTVSTNISNVNTTASSIANVNTVAAELGAGQDVTVVAADLSGTDTIGTVASDISNVNTAAGSIANVNTVAGSITNVNNVGGSIANVNTTATNIADVNTVATEINNNNLQTVAADIQAVIDVANDLNEATSEIDVVANNIASVNTVGTNIADVNTVAGISSDVTTAATNVTAFNNTYLGAASTAPTADPDGSALDLGDLYFDTTTNTMKVYSSSGWIAAGSSVNGTADRFTYTAIASQTTFSGNDDNTNSLAYDAGFLDVYMNGVKLVNGSDFTATNGTSVVLSSAAALNDTIEMIAYGTFTLADHLTETQSDARYVNVTGDTMTGNLDVGGTVTADQLTVYNGTSDPDVLFRNNGTGDVTLTFRRGAADDVYTDWSLINDNGTFTFRSDNSSDPDRTQLTMNQGDISFYEDTGTTAKFFWDASAESLGIGTSSPSDKLHVEGDIRVNNAIESANNLNLEAENGSMRFQTGSGSPSERMRIDSNGNVGIGTTSPNSALDVAGEITLKGTSSSFASVAQPRLYRSGSSSGSYPFNDFGHLIIQPRGDGANRDIVFATGTAGANKTVIDSSGNVGIGDTSPYTWSSVQPSLNLRGTSASFPNRSGALIFKSQSGTHMTVMDFETGNDLRWYQSSNSGSSWSERMRIDSSGNLLVGKTSTGLQTTGHEFIAGGQTRHTRDSATVMFLNRETNDGNILEFYKDNNTVGSIGATGGRLYIGDGTVALRIVGDADEITPWNATANTNRDAAIALGNSTNRFTDLYLSGGVYLGGTGSANKLDDYEEGTWTPTLTFAGGSGVAFTTQSGSYVKVGTIVTAQFRIELSSLGSSTGAATFGGLPFTATSVGTLYPAFYGLHHDVNSGSGGSTANVLPIGQITRNASYWNYYNADNTTTIGAAYFNNNSVINGTVTFRVN